MNAKLNLFIKGLILFLMILALLIPTLFINGLVYERMNRQQEAVQEISAKWGNAQQVSGPVLSIPYYDNVKADEPATHSEKKFMHVLPEQLVIDGKVQPEKRYRSIFEIVVYNSALKISGSFNLNDIYRQGIPAENIRIREAFISTGISDLRGIKEQVLVKWDDSIYSMNPGLETNDVVATGLSTPVKLLRNDSLNMHIPFSLDLHLKGSAFLNFTPLGKVTEVKIKSPWQAPSFDGAYLPDTRHITPEGFNASWKILHLNRNFPQIWTGSHYNINDSAFGVNLFLPMDNYKKTDRSVKYAVLFIVLTFLMFFFVELINKKLIHPFQYLLVGFALIVFYTLLLSLSEHLSYDLSYLVAAVMTISLITLYTKSILRVNRLAAMIGTTLTILYTFIFIIIQMEDYALLMGSIGLFLILAITMYFSRKIDWYRIDQDKPEIKN